jgi:hypothetical protein
MEAASRPPLELLSDLPVEEPVDAAAQRSSPPPAPSSAAPSPAAGASAAPPKDPAQTGITFLDPAALLLEPSAAAEPSAALAAAAPVVAPAAEPELVLEDPAVVEELLTAPPPPQAKPAAAAPSPPAASSVPARTTTAAPEAARAEVRVPIIKTASLSAAATKAAATKLAAATKRSTDPVAKPLAPAIPSPRPAAPAPPKPVAQAAAANRNEGLAGWTNARAAASPAAVPAVKSKSPPSSASAAPASAKPSAPGSKAAPTAAVPAATATPAVPMDRDFIARNQVVERYLSGRLPLKGATEFEQFVNKHPELLDEIGLPERVNAGLRLLEASGKPEPWQEAPRPGWQKPQVTIALAAIAGALAVALLALTGASAAKAHKIAELQKQATEQPLDPATSTREIRLMPSRSGASNAPAITIGGGGGAQLADFKIDESRSPYHIFRVTVDRIEQGRVAVITNLVKDSNGHLRLALNSTALGPGNYQLTIEGVNWRGDPEPDSWVTIGILR